MTKISVCIAKIQKLNPGVPIVKVMKEAVELKWGGRDFPYAWNNNDMLLQALEHYLKVKGHDNVR
jgi:hypothetical protein